MSGLILILLVGIVCLGCIGLAVYGIIKGIITLISNLHNGVEVECTIKDVKNIKNKDEKYKATIDSHIEIECTFEYEGKTLNKVLKVYNKIDEGKYKVGNKLKCKYNPKTEKLVDELNFKGKENRKFFTTVIFFLITAIYGIIFGNKGSIIHDIVLISLAMVVWYSTIFLFYDSYYVKDRDKYIKLKGHVIDYHVEYDTGFNNGAYNYYYPEISFKYNKEKKKYLSQRGSLKKTYNIGQEVDVYYNPETDKIYEKSNNKMCYIYMAIPPIFGLIALIKYLIK